MPVQRDPFYPSHPDGLSESLVAFSPTSAFYCLNFHCFPAEEKGERITLHSLGYLKRKGKKKKKKLSPERKVLMLFFVNNLPGKALAPRLERELAVPLSLLHSGKVKRQNSC